MGFNKRTALQLFFPEPMDSQDYTNLRMSGIKRVQMFYKTALVLPRQLEELNRMGVAVTLRLEEPHMVLVAESYYNAATHPSIRAGVEQIKRRVAVEATVAGNEPAHGYDLTWRSRNWGNNPDAEFPNAGGRAVAHAQGVEGVTAALRGVSNVITPGWEHKRITPRDHPQPGRMTWRELCLGAYNKCDNGAHLYAHSMLSPEDENRFLWALGEEVARCHRAVWLNEVSVKSTALDDVGRMAKIRLMADLIAQQEWGDRVVSFCPFVSNGRPDEEWSNMIMRAPQAYFELGGWLQT
jgi:hypothetical protein